MRNVIVLGGYGNFGKGIVENLAGIEGINIFIAGRNLSKSSALVDNLKANYSMPFIDCSYHRRCA